MTTTDHYVHIELLESGMIKTETRGVTVAQAVELIVAGLESLRKEAHRQAPRVSDGLLLPRTWRN